jgi:hypothetical protein
LDNDWIDSIVNPSISLALFRKIGFGSFVATDAGVWPAAELGYYFIVNDGAIGENSVLYAIFKCLSRS